MEEVSWEGLAVIDSIGDGVVDSVVEQDPIRKDGINSIDAIKSKYFGFINIILWIYSCS